MAYHPMVLCPTIFSAGRSNMAYHPMVLCPSVFSTLHLHPLPTAATTLHCHTRHGNGLPCVASTSLDLTLQLAELYLWRIRKLHQDRPCFAQELGLETEFCDYDFPKLLPLTGPLDRSQDSATLRVFCLPQFSGPSMHNLSSRT